VSVVLPRYNEELDVAAEVERICRALDGSGHPYELIVIDDGSADHTWAEVQRQAAVGPPSAPSGSR
jgi:glycosyltransferase involved in cell wall biosynthesis